MPANVRAEVGKSGQQLASTLRPRRRADRPSGDSRPRCLVLGDGSQASWVAALNRVENVEDDFDVMIALVASDIVQLEAELALVLPRCSNPAAPLIAGPRCVSPRADFVLSDTSTSSIVSALQLVRPLIRAVDRLPHLAQSADRVPLLALALAHTRKGALECRWAPSCKWAVDYPRLLGIPQQRAMLEELADLGLLQRRFFERTYVCDQCRSARVMVREVCGQCRSSHIAHYPLLHHYACGYQAPQPMFGGSGEGYECPKCKKELRHYGLDYDKPGSTFECRECRAQMPEPDVYFVCTDCNHQQPSDGAPRLDWHHYEITAEGIAAVQAGALPRADDPTSRRRSLRDFRVLCQQAALLAVVHARPLTALRMSIALPSIAESGVERAAEICHFAIEVAAQCLRESDFLASLSDGLIACLPETDAAAAQSIVRQIDDALRAAIKLEELDVAFELFTRPEEISKLVEAAP